MKGSKGASRFLVVIALGALVWWVFSNALFEFQQFRSGSELETGIYNRTNTDFEGDGEDIEDIEGSEEVEELREELIEKESVEPGPVLDVADTVVEYVKEVVIDIAVPEDISTKNIVDHIVETIEETISIPGPLFIENDNTSGENLSVSEVLYYTNQARVKEGLSPLKENTLLNKVAEIKVDDMFLLQYFEHMSPTGRDVSSLAEIVAYEYVSVGENLAMGNFDNDLELVTGWMNSPGHRANILGDQYVEIGISVKEGIYDGHKIWMAVQAFCRPLSDCPVVDNDLGSRIEIEKVVLEATSVLIDSLREDIENYYPKQGASYNNLIDEFNILVEDYNESSLNIKLLVELYNSQVNDFNICIAE